MDRIASPQDLQAELRSIMAFIHTSAKPDRQVIAAKLLDLAERVASPKIGSDAVEERRKKYQEVEKGARDWVRAAEKVETGLSTLVKSLAELDNGEWDIDSVFGPLSQAQKSLDKAVSRLSYAFGAQIRRF